MDPITHTLIAILSLLVAYFFGWKKGDWKGSCNMTAKFLVALHQMGVSVKVEDGEVYIISAVDGKAVKIQKDVNDNGRDF